jgi:hypothetical protein
MIRAINARRMRAGWAASAVASATAALLLTGSASAAVPAGHSAAADGRNMQTLFDTVRIFGSPNTRADVRDKLTTTGAGVRVACWTSGKDYKNLSIWYEITAPVAGYIPAFNLDAHFSPAKGIPHCLVPTFSTPFYALEVNLHIRTQPSIDAPISGYLANVGSKVVVSCYQNGTAIYGDPVWYHTVSPAVGYVTGRFLNTGGDPAPNVPRC